MSGDFQSVPMWRLIDRNVRSGLVMAWRLATSPTRTSPAFEKATTDGVVRAPSELGMTTGSPASRTDTTEFVVPRSMPTALGMVCSYGRWGWEKGWGDRDRPREVSDVHATLAATDIIWQHSPQGC